MDKYIQLDEEGYFHFEGQRIIEKDFGQDLLKSLTVEPMLGYYSFQEGQKVFIEAFDAPLVVYQIEHLKEDLWSALTPYDYQFQFSLHDLYVDEWDRFLGYDDKKRPFVFTRSAQADFFNSLDSFDDDSVTHGEIRYEVGPWLTSPVSTAPSVFWDNKYQENEKTWLGA